MGLLLGGQRLFPTESPLVRSAGKLTCNYCQVAAGDPLKASRDRTSGIGRTEGGLWGGGSGSLQASKLICQVISADLEHLVLISTGPPGGVYAEAEGVACRAAAQRLFGFLSGQLACCRGS